VYPAEYGADPTGAHESSDSVMKAVEDAFGIESEGELVGGVRDLGGVVIDLQGGNYTISKPIKFPSSGGGNLVVSISLFFLSSCFTFWYTLLPFFYSLHLVPYFYSLHLVLTKCMKFPLA